MREVYEIYERVCMDCHSRWGCKTHDGRSNLFTGQCSDCKLKDTDNCHVTQAEIENRATAATHSFCELCLAGRLDETG